MRGIVLVVAGTLALSACGGSSTGSSPVQRAADVAKSAGCSGYTQGTTQMFTQESGECQLDGKTVYVMTFRDKTSRDQWMKVGTMAGGSFGEGDLWILQGDDRDAVMKGTAAAGGKMA